MESTLEDVIDKFLDEHIGKPLYRFRMTDSIIFIQAGTMNKDEWIEMGEELVELLTSYNYKYKVWSASKESVTLDLN